VAASTKTRVLRVIEELGFRPSAPARSLSIGRSHTLALMVPDVTNPFYPALARGLQDAVRPAGLLVLLSDTGGDAAQERAFLNEALERRVDGLVMSSFQLTPADVIPANRAGVPVISVGSQLASADTDVVSANDEHIGADAVDHVADRGHTRIATITGPEDVEPGVARLNGVRRRALERGLDLPESRVIRSDFTRDGGHVAMQSLLELASRPTAVVCANDLMAIGALDAARERGVAVPADLALIGVDDIDASALVSPALTTIRLPAHEIGRSAGELLLGRIEGRAPTARRTVLVAHELITRETT
jgi:LacI family transcriptional regulator